MDRDSDSADSIQSVDTLAERFGRCAIQHLFFSRIVKATVTFVFLRGLGGGGFLGARLRGRDMVLHSLIQDGELGLGD